MSCRRVQAVRVPDSVLDEVRENGFSLMEGFLSEGELLAAQRGTLAPLPEAAGVLRGSGPLSGACERPVRGCARIPIQVLGHQPAGVPPRPRRRGRAVLGTRELHLYKVELWAKYSGASDYDQPLHRDYGSHSLVVPRTDGTYQQITTFIYLSDVGARTVRPDRAFIAASRSPSVLST